MSQRIFVIGSFAKGYSGFRGPILAQLNDAGCDVHLVCSEHDQDDLDFFASIGVTYHAAPLQRTGLNPFNDFKYAKYLTALFREHKPDIVFCYAQKPVVFGVPAAHKAGVKNINALMPGLGYLFSEGTGLKKKIAKAVAVRLHKRAKGLIQNLFFVNPNDHADFKAAGLIGKQADVTILPGEGKDLSHFAVCPMPTDRPPGFNLITRLLADKGVPDFVEAAKIVKKAHPEAVFDLIGPYDDNPRAVQPDEVAGWVDEGLIAFHGVTTDVRPYIENTTATVLPTTYREGLPNILLEGMAIGRPIVTYENAGASQAIESPEEIEPGLARGTNGFLIAPKRVDLLAKALLMLIDEPGLAESMGKAGRAFAEERFDVSKINSQIMKQIGVVE
ncbi:glycosyltransferase family 4 protein [Phycisphaeraceae bacterium D3-23]